MKRPLSLVQTLAMMRELIDHCSDDDEVVATSLAMMRAIQQEVKRWRQVQEAKHLVEKGLFIQVSLTAGP